MTTPKVRTKIHLHALSFVQDGNLIVVTGRSVGSPDLEVSKVPTKRAVQIFNKVRQFLASRTWYVCVGVTMHANGKLIRNSSYTEVWMPIEKVKSMTWNQGNKTFRVMPGVSPRLNRPV